MALQDEMIIEQIQIGPMQNFAYIIGCKSTREVAVIDPAWDVEALLNLMAERDYKLTAALVTHYHPDHCGGSFGKLWSAHDSQHSLWQQAAAKWLLWVGFGWLAAKDLAVCSAAGQPAGS